MYPCMTRIREILHHQITRAIERASRSTERGFPLLPSAIYWPAPHAVPSPSVVSNGHSEAKSRRRLALVLTSTANLPNPDTGKRLGAGTKRRRRSRVSIDDMSFASFALALKEVRGQAIRDTLDRLSLSKAPHPEALSYRRSTKDA